MADARISQVLFTQGELGPNMDPRADSDIYTAGCRKSENVIHLIHGGVTFRAGLMFVAVAGSNKVRFANFNFQNEQEYLLVFTATTLKIYKDNALKATLTTPYPDSVLRNLRMAQSGDSLIVSHPNYPPKELMRKGDHTQWELVDFAFTKKPYHKFNWAQKLTPSAISGSITLTLDGTANYWTANHVGVSVKINGGYAKIDSVVSGLVANATVTTSLSNTNQSEAWKEEAFTAAHGWPRTATFHENRLVFGGTRDAPDTFFGSKTGDFNNFDDSDTKNDNAFAFTLSTDQVHIIRDIKSTEDLIVLTGEGEFKVTGGSGAITATNIKVTPQSFYGIADIPASVVDGEIIFATNNSKELRSMVFDLATNKYKGSNYTAVWHHMLSPEKPPLALAYLRSYKDTQANYVFIPRGDGQMAVLGVQTEKNVLGMNRFVTDGKFLDACVVACHDENGKAKDTLYVAVERQNGVFIEALTEKDVNLDCWFEGSDPNGKMTWGGMTALANQTVNVIADDCVHGLVVVGADGSITLDRPAKHIYVGLPYVGEVETMPLTFAVQGKMKRGDRMRKKRVYVNLRDAKSLKVDGKAMSFRYFGGSLLDQPIPPFTGTKHINIGGWGRDITITLTMDSPLPVTILSLAVDVSVA